MARSTRTTDADYYAQNPGEDGYQPLGYYQRTNAQVMIDNFMIAYIGADKVLTNVPRYEVSFHMQRAVQEFSYDTFHSNSRIELELGPSLTIKLPNDFVNWNKITRTSEDGRELQLFPSPRTKASKAYLQDDDYEIITDSNGEGIAADQSETIKRYKDEVGINQQFNRDSSFSDSDGLYTNNDNSYSGRKYGLTPSDATGNGTFLMDLDGGIIYFDSVTQEGDLIVFDYISDGIGNNDDLENVFIPKLAEDAVYASVLYNLAKIRPAAAQLASLYKKEAKAKLNNAKIRLMDLRPEEMKNVLRNKSKWIKH